jgi:hypothetical protein
MMADLDLQIGWVQTFFLWKYLILSHFLILKTPTEDSILCHKRDFIHHFFTKGAFACLILLRQFLIICDDNGNFKKIFPFTVSFLFYLNFPRKSVNLNFTNPLPLFKSFYICLISLISWMFVSLSFGRMNK